MKLIDADAKITALLYDEEHEETKRVEMTIADFLDSHTEEGCPQNGGWISVKDRLPEESGNVLVCVKLDYANGARYVQMCHYSAYKKQFGCFDTLDKSGFPKHGVVTHWMLLPEIPKEGEA